MTIAYISHADCLLHDVGNHHPERPARLNAIQDQLVRSGFEFILKTYDAPLADRRDIERVHDPDYVASIFARSPKHGIVDLDEDTMMMPDTLNAALRAAGAVVHGVDLALDGEVASAFCAVRPPGHHAEKQRAMGFCLFNNIAIGTAYALDIRGLSRVAIVDFDVHQGNGTEDIFHNDSRVLFCSCFQHPFYPYTDPVTDTVNTINTALPAGTQFSALKDQIEQHWLPSLHAFKPELVMISAGFDGHVEDELSQWMLGESDYAWITRQLVTIANQYSEGRIVSSLEGGYALGALGRSVVAHLDALLGNK